MSERTLKTIASGEDARERLLKGINTVADVVGSTMGYRGRTVLIESQFGLPEATQDGYKVLQSIHLADDPVESQACEISKQASQRTVDLAGDGPQPLYSKILTPDGWSTMREMKVGSIICGTNNTVQTVLGVYPKGEKEILKMKFSNGREVECCEDHLWEVVNDNGVMRIITAGQILKNGLFRIKKRSNGKESPKCKNYIRTTPVEFNKNKNIVIDPYLLGTLIGDGSLSAKGRSAIELTLGFKKEHIINKIVLPEGITFVIKRCEDKSYIRVRFKGVDKTGKTLKDHLKDIGLLGVLGKAKFIPKEYLYSDSKDRRALLSGLIDTDGHLNKRGLFQFSTSSALLYTDFIELCRGLGMSLSCHKIVNGESSFSAGTISYRANELKGYKNGIKIIDIEKTGIKTKMQCIKVSNDDSLYITDDYVVTHNTTSTVVLLQAFFANSLQAIKDGKSPIDVRNEIEKSKDLIIKYLDEISIPVTDKLIYDIAYTSSHSDEEIAKIVADAFIKAGEYGSVSHLRSVNEETYLEHIKGTLVEGALAHELLINNFTDRTCEYDDNPLIVCSDIAFKTFRQIEPFLAFAINNKRQIVIVADWNNSQCIGVKELIVKNVLNPNVNLKCMLVNAPSFGNKRRDLMTDLAMICGTQILDSLAGDVFDGREAQFMGTCEKAVSGKTDTIITPNLTDEILDKIKSKIGELEEIANNTKNQLEKKYNRERISKLSGGVSLIKVGSIIESELQEKIDRVDDAVCAVRSAKEEGVVAGGGMALGSASFVLNLDSVSTWALLSPLNKILENANASDKYELKEYPIGYDVKNYKEANMIDAGIVDSTKAIKQAVINAVSASNTLLMTDNVITNKRVQYASQ